MVDKQISVIEELADTFGDIRYSYSGRGMYGESCVGIVTDSPQQLIEQAIAVGITGAVMDSMGLQTIVYWPHIQTS